MTFNNPVLSSTLRVIKNAKSVSLNHKKIESLAMELSKAGVTVPDWPGRELHLVTKDIRRLLDYIIVLDSLNFCFWSENDVEKWRIDHDGMKYGGYFALALALKRFFEANPAKADFKYLAQISFGEFSDIFKGDGVIPLLKKRWEILRAVSRVVLDKYSGNSERLVLSGSHQASKFVSKMAKELPSFNDEAMYNGKKVYLWKRAQILAADIYGATRGAGVGYFEDLDYLTAFPDYKLPQILNYWGVMEYSPGLLKKIKEKQLIKAGSKEEVELRSATVWAVEYLKEALTKNGRRLRSFEIDWFLWSESKRVQMNRTHHLTETIYY